MLQYFATTFKQLKRCHIIILHTVAIQYIVAQLLIMLRVVWDAAASVSTNNSDSSFRHGAGTWILSIAYTTVLTLALVALTSIAQTTGHRLYIHGLEHITTTIGRPQSDVLSRRAVATIPYLLFLHVYINLMYPPGTACFKAMHDSNGSASAAKLHTSDDRNTCSFTCNAVYNWWSPTWLACDTNQWARLCYQINQYLVIELVYLISCTFNWSEETKMAFFVLTPLVFYYLFLYLHAAAHNAQLCVEPYQRYTNTTYHRQGYNDRSRSMQILSWGEMLHNNHHYDPSNVNMAHAPDEIDIGYYAIQVLAKLKLVKFNMCQTSQCMTGQKELMNWFE